MKMRTVGFFTASGDGGDGSDGVGDRGDGGGDDGDGGGGDSGGGDSQIPQACMYLAR